MNTQRKSELAILHQLSAAEEAGSAMYCLRLHPAIIDAIQDRIAGHQYWAERYAAYSREQLGISDEDHLYA